MDSWYGSAGLLYENSFFTGVSEGNIGSARIIKMLDVKRTNWWRVKRIYSIENFLMSRRLMYWQVYLHKTAVAAKNDDNTLRERENWQCRWNSLPPLPSPTFFQTNTLADSTIMASITKFRTTDDNDLWSALKYGHHIPTQFYRCWVMEW